MLRIRRTLLVGAVLVGAGVLLWHPVRASIFGEENATLIKQLSELMQIREELQTMSEAAERSADAIEDVYDLYDQAQAAVDELKSYSTDKFVADLKKDLYRTYPGFELLLEGPTSSRMKHWKGSHARSPFTTYEMISAVFGDLTDPIKERARAGELSVDRAYLWRYESAGALALAADAEAWTESADEDALELYRLAADADADQAEHLSARALGLIAVQNSHIIRLLSRNVRLDGVRAAMEWGDRVEGLNNLHAQEQAFEAYTKDLEPPRMMSFPSPF